MKETRIGALKFAGRVLLDYCRQVHHVSVKESRYSIVTEVDLTSEKYLLKSFKLNWTKFIILSFAILMNCQEQAFKPEQFEKSIITREQWGSTPADSTIESHTIDRITLHHGGVTFPDERDPIEYLQSLQKWSRTEKSWIDNPYHYVIDLRGRIYEARPIQYPGDTNTDYNPRGHALICVVGNYEQRKPNRKQLAAIIQLMAWLCWKYNLSPDTIKGHRDYTQQTVCPGKYLNEYLTSGYFKQKVEKLLTPAH